MSQSKMNYLCRLPDELLGSIFDLAQSPNRRILLPYSKRLLPFLRYYLYHRVRISSYHSLNLFCSSTQSNPLLLNLVSSLKIRIEFVPGRGPAREARDVGVPSNRTLINVLSDSFEVEEISIYGSTRIAFMLLVSDVMSQALPKLSSLSPTSTFFRIDNPWHPSHYTKLSHSRLSQLRLTVVRTRESIGRNTRAEGIIPISPISIYDLSLEGPIVPWSGLDRLLPSFHHLTSLSIVDTNCGPCELIGDFIEIMLSSIDYEAPLHSLNVEYECTVVWPQYYHGIDCSAVSSLSSLSLRGAVTSDDSNFYSRLLELPLETITFQEPAAVSLVELAKLISPPDKHETLKTIVLNNVEGRIGTRIRDVGVPRWKIMKKEWTVHSDWILPEWSESFDEKGLIKFLEIANGEGIEVSGSAIEAIGFDAEFEKEWEAIVEFEEREEMEKLSKGVGGVSLEE